MDDKTKERWEILCEQAAIEQDSTKLIELVQEINRLLGEKQQRLEKKLNENAIADSIKPTATEPIA